MLPGPALIQADLDYHTADVDKKIQQHIVASQGHSVELDRAFVMAIEMVCLFLFVQILQGFYFQLQVWQMCVYKRDCFWNWHSHTCHVMLVWRWCRLICGVESYMMFVMFVMFELLAFTICQHIFLTFPIPWGTQTLKGPWWQHSRWWQWWWCKSDNSTLVHTCISYSPHPSVGIVYLRSWGDQVYCPCYW